MVSMKNTIAVTVFGMIMFGPVYTLSIFAFKLHSAFAQGFLYTAILGFLK